MNFNAFLPLKGLTTIASVCFICKSETHSDSQSPRPTRRQAALHHRNPPRLLAPSPHPPSHRLCRLRPRPRPLSLGFDRQLSRRTHQADQPLRPTENHGPTVVAQLPETGRTRSGSRRSSKFSNTLSNVSCATSSASSRCPHISQL